MRLILRLSFSAPPDYFVSGFTSSEAGRSPRILAGRLVRGRGILALRDRRLRGLGLWCRFRVLASLLLLLLGIIVVRLGNRGQLRLLISALGSDEPAADHKRGRCDHQGPEAQRSHGPGHALPRQQCRSCQREAEAAPSATVASGQAARRPAPAGPSGTSAGASVIASTGAAADSISARRVLPLVRSWRQTGRARRRSAGRPDRRPSTPYPRHRHPGCRSLLVPSPSDKVAASRAFSRRSLSCLRLPDRPAHRADASSWRF